MPHASDGAALLRAICDNPDEDTPRLMYADWLDEQGGEANAARAEFIRLQIVEMDKAGRTNVSSVGVLRFATARERDLIKRFGGTQPGGWSADLPGAKGVRYENSSESDRFARGFPWQVYSPDVDTFLKIAPALFDAAPITYLHLNSLKINTAKALAASPFLARIRQWQDVYSRRTDKMLAEIGKSGHLGNLREIDLTGSPITAAGVRSLLFAPSIRSVKRLAFASCEVGDAGAEVIAASPACAALEHLDLGYRPLTAVGTRALANAPFRQTLRSLVLYHTGLDDDAVGALASVEWPRLHSLSLSNNAITDRGAEAILDNPFWRDCGCALWLMDNQLSDAMKVRLTESLGPRVRLRR